MGLKSKEWFYKHCLREAKGYTAFAHLSWDLLEKGIGQKDSTRGHVTQAIGAVQQFLDDHAQHVQIIKDSSSTEPFDLRSHKKMHSDWCSWLAARSGTYGRPAFGYDFDTLKNYLTPNLGGARTGGGGGDDELKRVFRLVPEFSGRS
jgi:hypothetical protein